MADMNETMSPETKEKADLKAGAPAHTGANVVMPQAPNIEKSLLAMMTIDPTNIVSQCVSKGMTSDFFYIPAHRILWEIFRERYDKGIPIDVTSVMQQLADKKQLEAVGGPAGLTDVFSYTTNTGLFNLHFETLKEKYIRRSIILTANQASESAYTSEAEVDALLDETEQAVLKIRQSTDKGGEWKLSADIAAAVNNMERMMSSKGEVLGLTTGYPRLDSMINGLKGGELFIIAARPSMGKTSFLLNIMEHLALNVKKPILIFSCEMPSVQLVERLLYARSGVSKQQLLAKQGGLSKEDMKRLKYAINELRASNIVIDDTAAISIAELRAKARRVMRDHRTSAPSASITCSSCAPTPSRPRTVANVKSLKSPAASRAWPRN